MSFLHKVTDELAKNKEKEKKDFEKVKEAMMSIHNLSRTQDENFRMIINLQLTNGDFDPVHYANRDCFTYNDPTTGQIEEINFDDDDLVHTPLIANFVQPMFGEAARQDYEPEVVDTRYSKFEDHRAELLEPMTQQFRNGADILRQKLTAAIEDTSGKSIDQLTSIPANQNNIQQTVENILNEQISDPVKAFLEGNYSAVIVQHAAQLLQALVDLHDIKSEKLQGLQYAVALGQIYYFCGNWNGEMMFKSKNPLHVLWQRGKMSEDRIEHADWVKSTDMISLTQAKSTHKLGPEAIKELESFYGAFKKAGSKPGVFGASYEQDVEFMYKYSMHQKYFSAKYDKGSPGSLEASANMDMMYSEIMNTFTGDAYTDCFISEEHICYRLPIILHEVDRYDDRTGQVETYEFGEHYKEQPGDIEVREIRGDAIYQGWLLAGRVWTGISLVKCAYERQGHFHRAIMPYAGGMLSTHHGTVRSRSMVDRARGANKMFDVILAGIKRDMKSDWGPVFMMTMNARPKNMKPETWFHFIKYFGMMWVDPKQANMRGVELNNMRQLDLSRTANMAQKLQMLNYWKEMVAFNLFISEARAEGIGQYSNKEIVEQSQQVMYNKTGLFEEKVRKIGESALEIFFETARHYYSEHKLEAKLIFDQVSIELLDVLGKNYFKQFGIRIKDSKEKSNELKFVRSLLQSGIQNQLGLESAFKIAFSKSKEQVWDILKEDINERKKESQLQFQQQQQVAQQKIQADLIDSEKGRQLEKELKLADLASKERRSAIEVQKFALANDLNFNQVSDLYEGAIAKLQNEYAIHKDKLDFEKEKFEFEKGLTS